MSGTTKVAAVQAAPSFLNVAEGLQRAVALIEQAAAQGCGLIVFPETWLPGYPNHIWLGPVAWQMQFVGRYFENSVEAGDKIDAGLAEAARVNNIQVSMGLSERDGGSLYIAQWLYGADGNVLQRRRKLKPTHVERTVFGEGDGSDLDVVTTPIGKIGQLACWEHLQPLTKFAMYSQNEQIHCAAWPNLYLYRGAAYALGDVVNTAASRIYAVEGGCFVVAACGLVSKEQQDIVCQGDAAKEALCPVGGGFAAIFAPDGQSIGNEIAHDQEGLVIAEIDLSAIVYAKTAADPAGHYSRKDVTRLLLDKTRQRAVMDFGQLPESLPSQTTSTGQDTAISG